MKKITLALMIVVGLTTTAKAQLHVNKDGSPDMRYKSNKQIYGNPYKSSTYSSPTYQAPTYEAPTYEAPSYNSTPTYTPSPSNTYSNPYPTKKDGTPDMRYKANRDIYSY